MKKIKNNASENGGDYQQKLEHGVDKATVVAHDTIDSLSDAARPALDQLVSGAHGAVDRAGAAATNAAGSLGVKGDQLNASRKRGVARAGRYVRQHPMASLGLAVAAGFLMSRLLASR